MAESKAMIVAALDFGTTFSGWAYSFLHDFQSDPTKATVQHWSGGSLLTEKTPTCALIERDINRKDFGYSLTAFGYEAENKYKDLVENGDHEAYYYFRHFKMALSKGIEKKINLDLKIKDEMGKSLPALTVFALSIEFLADDLIKSCENKLVGGITKEDVHWVLTVPAIWTDAAKQFMRESAKKGGIASEKLSIALEPESASVFCRNLSVDKFVGMEGDTISTYPVGTKYMILDAGGGTIDITVHEITSSGGLKELIAASGGGWGGTLVDKAFEDLLVEILGKEIFGAFVETETEDWLELGRTFELKKKSVDPNKDNRITMKFPISLLDLYKKKKKKSLEDMIAESKLSSEIELRGDKVRINSAKMKALFETSVSKTVAHVNSLLKDSKVRGLKTILMVGGFSESPMLQNAVKQAFSNLNVIVPKEASSAILQGAVIYGHNPEAISQRILKYTYGSECMFPFRDGIDPESKRFATDVGMRCQHRFEKHVEKDQPVEVGEVQKQYAYSPYEHNQKMFNFHFFATEMKNPVYVDQGCTCIGKLDVDISDVPGDLDRNVYISLMFGDTEIKATARIEETGQTITATLDFLG